MYTEEISIGRIAAAVAHGRHISRQKFRNYRLVYLQNTVWAIVRHHLISSFGSPISIIPLPNHNCNTTPKPYCHIYP